MTAGQPTIENDSCKKNKEKLRSNESAVGKLEMERAAARARKPGSKSK